MGRGFRLKAERDPAPGKTAASNLYPRLRPSGPWAPILSSLKCMCGECPQPRGPQAEGRRPELPGEQPRTEGAKPVGTWAQGCCCCWWCCSKTGVRVGACRTWREKEEEGRGEKPGKAG